MTISSFESLDISSEIKRSLKEMGFTTPTEIQAEAIPLLLNIKEDFVGQAQTGTGKTASFVIPLLEKIDLTKDFVQAIILTPTRELAFQIESEIKLIGKYLNLKTACVYGGVEIERQMEILKHDKPQIVVGTPGRTLDLLKRRSLKLDHAKFCVLDEADEMLTMGFIEDVSSILNKFQLKKQIIMFSATMPSSIKKLIEKDFNRPKIIRVEKVTLSNENIEQKYFAVREKHFKEALSRLIDNEPRMYGIVFCRTKIETREVCDDLIKRGKSAEVLNGDMGQAERDHAMKKFKAKKTNLLVCTDVAARGIDVNNLTHVINYGLPRDNESYVHRIGRTARAGEKGKAFTIVGTKSAFAIKNIEQHINQKIEKCELPSVDDLKMNLVQKEIVSANDILSAIQLKGDGFLIDKSFSLLEEEFKNIDKKDLLKLMFVWKFNKEFRHYNNLADIETASITKTKPNKRDNKKYRTRL